MDNVIQFSEIALGDRIRKHYSEPELLELAESIKLIGLTHPLILDEKNTLTDGGRRYNALAKLGTKELYFGVTGDPEKFGFLRGTSKLRRVKEMAANAYVSMTWQERMFGWMAAWEEAQTELQRTIGVVEISGMLSCSQSELSRTKSVHDPYMKSPDKFKDVKSLKEAQYLVLKEEQTAQQIKLAKLEIELRNEDVAAIPQEWPTPLQAISVPTSPPAPASPPTVYTSTAKPIIPVKSNISLNIDLTKVKAEKPPRKLRSEDYPPVTKEECLKVANKLLALRDDKTFCYKHMDDLKAKFPPDNYDNPRVVWFIDGIYRSHYFKDADMMIEEMVKQDKNWMEKYGQNNGPIPQDKKYEKGIHYNCGGKLRLVCDKCNQTIG